MFKLTNARGETVDINTPSLRSYTPTGLGLQITNSYSPYETYFIPTKSVLSQGIMQVYMKFGDIESQSYQSFSDFAQFLAYQPYTLEYDFDDNNYYRDARLQSLTKTEIGGSTIDAYDRLNEIFTLEFINNWYNNKSAEYKSYDPDPNLGTYGKIYGPKYDPTVNRNLLLGTSVALTGVWNNPQDGNFNAQGGIYYLAGGKKVSGLYNQYGPTGYLTLSFDWTASGSNISGTFKPQWNNVPWDGGIGTSPVKPSITNKSGHYKSTVQLNFNGYSTSIATFIMFRKDNLQGTITISNLKLEAGNIATDWTPAPEDNLAIPFGYAYAGLHG